MTELSLYWLSFIPILAAVVAAFAAAIAAWNVSLARANADRQFALSYIHDVNRWAAEIMTAFKRASALFGGPFGGGKSYEEKGKDCNWIIGDLFYQKNVGYFLFPSDTAAPQLWLDKMIAAIFSFQERLWSNDHLRGDDSKLEKELRDGFINSVREELRVGKRYADAKRYLQ